MFPSERILQAFNPLEIVSECRHVILSVYRGKPKGIISQQRDIMLTTRGNIPAKQLYPKSRQPSPPNM